MIVRFENQKERRAARIKFYKDDVFLITHEAIKDLCSTFSLEELFVTAEAFTCFLLDNDLTDKDVLQYEIDDLSEETADDTATFLIITLSFLKLCALRKTRENAEDVARALIGFCQKYNDFTSLLRKFDKKEQSRWFENKRVNLLKYELASIEKTDSPMDSKTLVTSVVDSAIGLSVAGMEHVEVALSEVNDKTGHCFDSELQRLREERKKKSVPSINIEKLNDIHDNDNVNIGKK